MPTYQKLVRDGIPGIIAAQGKALRTRILDTEEYIEQLRIKLKEEAAEYYEADSDEEALEELADMLEVILALALTHGCEGSSLERIRADKAARRGGFKERIFLLVVADELQE